MLCWFSESDQLSCSNTSCPCHLSMVSHGQTRQVVQNARPPVQGSNALDLVVTAVSAVPMSLMLMVLLVGMGPLLSDPSRIPLRAAMTTTTTNCLLTAPAHRLQARRWWQLVPYRRHQQAQPCTQQHCV